MSAEMRNSLRLKLSYLSLHSLITTAFAHIMELIGKMEDNEENKNDKQIEEKEDKTAQKGKKRAKMRDEKAKTEEKEYIKPREEEEGRKQKFLSLVSEMRETYEKLANSARDGDELKESAICQISKFFIRLNNLRLAIAEEEAEGHLIREGWETFQKLGKFEPDERCDQIEQIRQFSAVVDENEEQQRQWWD